MKVKFWGVRGSIPTPLTPSRIKSKISAIVGQITPDDLEDNESRERFLAELEPWLFGTVGGNSPCLTLTFDNLDEYIVFDCGSGIREMGLSVINQKIKVSRFHIFLSHFHWDHLQGLPFFVPGYNPTVNVDFYSPVEDFEKILRGQMSQPYFPVQLDAMGANKKFNHIVNEIMVCNCNITWKKMNHPGGSYAFCVNENGKRFIYATDTELTPGDFDKNEENTVFFNNADMIVIDSQYTLGEAIDKFNWGHSAFSLAVDFAANWNIKHMVMFHHDPAYDDHKLFGILQSAKLYKERMKLKGIDLTLACEGMEISI